MRSNSIIFLIFYFVMWTKSEEIKEKRWRSTQVILVGATGDLAKKYLWKGLFDLYLERNKPEELIKVYGAARVDQEKGQNQLRDILESTLKCPLNKDDRLEDCIAKQDQFKKQIHYYRLKNDLDYKALCDYLNNKVNGEAMHLGRIFYLSVPPSAYSSIAKSIHNHCRPHGKGSYIRVILEKPFGSDLASAKKLSQDLQEFFEEDEMYRIDHYLGKTGVSQILKFRNENRDTFGHLWNRDNIESIEIALKEKQGCKGRTKFYNEYGVIRDVIQNHITEVMALVSMEMPVSINNITEIHQNKLSFLKGIKPLHGFSAVTGQYLDYVKECESDGGGNAYSCSKTPTFAAVLLHLQNSKWNGIPFVVFSGKQLEERSAYVRVIFKKKYTMKSSLENCVIDQLVFHIQGGNLNKPALIVSKSLPTVKTFSDWKPMNSKPDYLYDCPGDSLEVFEPLISHDAYSALIKAAYHGKQDMFIGTEDLIASWEIWTPLLHSLESVTHRIYSKDNLENLDFSIRGQRVEFTRSSRDDICSSEESSGNTCQPEIRPGNLYRKAFFRGQSLVTGSRNVVVKKLAENIQEKASLEVGRSGVFHLALSGGSSPLFLFKHLAFFSPEFPWHGTHIWVVDERCNPLTEKQSNYRFIYQNLIEYIPISRSNVHPMPISLRSGLCSMNDNGNEHYEAELRGVLGDKSLNYVVLGVGHDGHTASLFPGSDSLYSRDWVTITESKHIEPLGQRMTMTFSILNKAEAIGVLILGEKKADIVHKLADKDNESNVKEIPITGINPQSNELIWYIDDKAMKKVH